MTITQISVFLENKSGRLSDVTGVLAENGINIRALSVAETMDYGVLRIIVNNPELACKRLREAGFTVTETQVIALKIPDRPGGLSEVIRVLADESINVEYTYAFVGTQSNEAIVVLRLEDTAGALEILRRHGLEPVTSQQIYRM